MDLGNQDINDLLNKYGAIGVAVGPLSGMVLARLIFGKSKLMTTSIRIGAGWAATQTFLTPHVDQMKQTLMQLTSFIHNNGY